MATSVLAVKATPKALNLIAQAKEEKGEDLTKLEKIRVAGPVYIPSVLIGISTLACIFGANALSKRQQASLVSAYALLDNSYKEYKNKVTELYGEDVNWQVMQGIAKDNSNGNDISVGDDEELFYDYFGNRYFNATMKDVIEAEYRLNRDLHTREWATINDFYEYLGLDTIPGGDELGWSTGINQDHYGQTWVDFNHHKTVMDDGLECYILSIIHEPQLYWHEY